MNVSFHPHFYFTALPNPILWHAVSGDTVILPCVTNTSGILNISRYKIYWQTEGRLVVHLLYNGKELPTQQYRRYHNRTKLFLDQLEHGNFSLMLSGIEPADEAVYICIAGAKPLTFPISLNETHLMESNSSF
uniref:Ig-like domain-containing protein n=1 Tax=Pelusios castaneus TaxID=367368 RepID=A0A8C8VLI1_9SAUR